MSAISSLLDAAIDNGSFNLYLSDSCECDITVNSITYEFAANYPSHQPTLHPTPRPTPPPTQVPSPQPTLHPTRRPTPPPTQVPSPQPTQLPTLAPTLSCDAGESYDLELNTCTPCLNGTFYNASNSSVGNVHQCAGCPNGRVAPRRGMTFCEICEVGKYASTDKTSCGTCSPGQEISGGSCIKCSTGRSSDSGTECRAW